MENDNNILFGKNRLVTSVIIIVTNTCFILQMSNIVWK